MRLFTLLYILLSSLVTFAGNKTTDVFSLDHHMTGMCKKRIIENMRFEKGVSKIDISIPDNTIAITFDAEKTNTDQIIGAFKKIGFNAFLITPNNSEKAEPTCQEDKITSNKEQESECEYRIIFSIKDVF